MAAQPELLQACFGAAAHAARPALERCLEGAIAELQAAETHSMKVAEREIFSTAWRTLQAHKAHWGADYQTGLLEAFAASGTSPSHAHPAHDAASGSFSTFSGLAPLRGAGLPGQTAFALVDDAQVVEGIESARLLQRILPGLEQTLAELDALVSSAQGLANVQPEGNPLRPAVFTQCLQHLLYRAAPDAHVLALWLKPLAEPFGQELRLLYEHLVRQLEGAQVRAARYRVLQAPSSPAAVSNGVPRAGSHRALDAGEEGEHGATRENGEGEAQPPSQYADLSRYEIRSEMFQNFLFHGGAEAQHGLSPSYYRTVDAEMAALEAAPESQPQPLAAGRPDAALAALASVDRPMRPVGVSSPLDPQRWGAYGRSRERAIVRTQLRREATLVGQVLGLDVVRKLVGQVAQDPRLLAPVREAIVALEPSLLRLAMVDPRFFSDETHAGRRLIERVAQRSLRYNDELAEDFAAFFGPVSDAFNRLNGQAIADAQPFAGELADLDAAWGAQDQADAQARRQVLDTLHFAENRQSQADDIAFALSRRTDLEQVPGVVLDFLFGPWALVMAHARLADTRNQIDPEGFGSVVPDLLWSVKRHATLKQPGKLIAMIPGLLEKLHAGLAMLGQSAHENSAFFDTLMKLHQPVLKLRRIKSLQDATESAPLPLESEGAPLSHEERRIKAQQPLFLGRGDRDMAGFQEAPATDAAPLAALPADPGPSMPLAAQAAARSAPEDAGPAFKSLLDAAIDADAVLLGLSTGSWVDLFWHARWLRAQLVWASGKGTLFMFVSHGGQPHSMTRRSCERLLRERLMRAVDAGSVVEQALDAVAHEAGAKPAPGRRAGAHRAAGRSRPGPD
jgi:Protein of unknown function (DUF1631)